MSPGGRPPLDPRDYADTITDALSKGAHLETAISLSGISRPTFYVWLKRGARARIRHEKTGDPIPKEDAVYAEFSYSVDKAIATAETNHLATITAASKDSWQAAAWILERRFPDKYARRTAHRFEDDAGEAVTLDRIREAIQERLSDGNTLEGERVEDSG